MLYVMNKCNVMNPDTSVLFAFMFHIQSIESSPPETSFRPDGEKQTAITLFLDYTQELRQGIKGNHLKI